MKINPNPLDFPNYIPITEKYGERFCAAPWTSLIVEATGEVKFCCMTTGDLRPGVMDGKPDSSVSINDIVNSSLGNSVRKKFLNGDMARRANGDNVLLPPKKITTAQTYCDTCWKNEKKSDFPTENRLSNNQWADDVIDEVIKNTDDNGVISKQSPTWLDVAFSNKCNFSCIGCDVNNSSAIAKYQSAYELRDGNREYVIEPYTEADHLLSNVNADNLIDYILENKDTLEHIHFQGGEPLLMPEVYQMLDKLIEHGLYKEGGIKLWFHTNGSIRTYKGVDIFKKYLSKWEDRFWVTMSHDGYGPRGEYIRYGYNDKKFLGTYNRLSEMGITIHVQHSLNIFNILHQYECLEWYIENMIPLLEEPNHFQITLNPWNELECYQYANIKLIPELYEKAVIVIDKCIARANELEMESYANKLSRYKIEFETSNVRDITDKDKENFILSVNEFDRVRGTNFHQSFPELKPYWDYCNI